MNQKGMSLIELTIADALAVGLALGVSKIAMQSNNNVKSSEKDWRCFE